MTEALLSLLVAVVGMGGASAGGFYFGIAHERHRRADQDWKEYMEASRVKMSDRDKVLGLVRENTRVTPRQKP